MANPFKSGEGGGPTGPMQPGEQRIIHARDKPGGEIIKTIVIKRTDRPYVQDLCDAYNEANTNPEIEWFVAENGELKLGERFDTQASRARQLAERTERDRRRWVAEYEGRNRPSFAEAAE